MTDQADLFPELIDTTREGTVWWAGNWQCRNWHGYFQHREGGRGHWCFVIQSFGGDPAGDGRAELHRIVGQETVPIDAQNRILVRGRRYGRDRWHH